jgi:hypothetical protein
LQNLANRLRSMPRRILAQHKTIDWAVRTYSAASSSSSKRSHRKHRSGSDARRRARRSAPDSTSFEEDNSWGEQQVDQQHEVGLKR